MKVRSAALLQPGDAVPPIHQPGCRDDALTCALKHLKRDDDPQLSGPCDKRLPIGL